jgi:hypothetical protein
MPEAWQQRIETIASNLLTLEVNTAVKEDGISAQKMPELPLALHLLVDCYGDYLKKHGCAVTKNLISLAAGRINAGTSNEAAAIRHTLERWDPKADTTEPANELTNGAESFEAFLWAARACDNGRQLADAKASEPALIARIDANARQLREAAIVLEKEFSSNRSDLQDSPLTYEMRLNALAQGNEADMRSRLFGGTVDQTVHALFRHPRPVLSIAPDLTVLIRKAWDIGLEEIRFQTMLQLDGDVLVRVARPEDAAQKSYLSDVHRQAVEDGIAQWRLMYRVIGELISDLGRLIFGRGS